MSETILSVILSTTGQRKSLLPCLESIVRSLRALADPAELLVVHNSQEPSDELRGLCSGIDACYLHEPKMGLSIARNRGVLEARGEVVAFTDDDVIVSPDWAPALVRHFRTMDVEAVTGRVLSSAKEQGATEWHAIYGEQPETPVLYDSESGIPFVVAGRCGIGNNMAFRTEFLRQCGLFDPVFGLGGPLPGGEEIDRFHAVLLKGKKILYAPDVCVEHAFADSRGVLYRKIQGFAAAQTGFFTKCLFRSPASLIPMFRYVAGRARSVMSRRPIPEGGSRKRAPRSRIISGSLAGPWIYLLARVRESLWPSRNVILPSIGPRDPARPPLLMILYNAGLGGAEQVARSLAAGLDRQFETSVIVPSPGQTTAGLCRAGIPVGVVPRERLHATWNPFHFIAYLLKFPGTVVAYQRTIRHTTPVLVHVDNFLNLPALLAARLLNVQTLLHLQEIPQSPAKRLLARCGSILAGRIIAVSQTAAEALRGSVDQQKISVVYNGTRACEPAPAYNPHGWISFVGRLSEDKDPMLFIRAAARVFAEEPNAKFHLCGITVPGRERYEAALWDLLARSRIPQQNFLISRDQEDVQNLLRQSAVAVVCSAVPESFGLVAIEAMAQARPVVVPRSGAFPEFIADGMTGTFYSPGNLDELVRCILDLLRDPVLAQRIGLAGHATVREKFTEEKMVAGIVEEYEKSLSSRDVHASAMPKPTHSE